MRPQYGGYLPLEIPRGDTDYFGMKNNNDILRLNSGRATFYFAAKHSSMKVIYLPYFTCSETKMPFIRAQVEIKYYTLDDNLLPTGINPGRDDYLLWTNYYGNATDAHIKHIANTYPNLIIDNCHAFFSSPIKHAYNCYSARKFFGVPDGAYLLKEGLALDEDRLTRDTSYQYAVHLIKQIDLNTNEGYPESLDNEDRLRDQYRSMSNFTRHMLTSIDYKCVARKRRANFEVMHEFLSKYNIFNVNTKSFTHMYYPFLYLKDKLRQDLISHQLYNPCWWSHVIKILPESSIEHMLSKYMIMLPIDQRYDPDDIAKICNIVIKSLND